MKRITILIAAALLAGCSSFKMGGLAYCPAGHVCSLTVAPPAQP